MLQIALTIPIILFLVLGRVTRAGWRLQVALLLVSPIVATLLLTAGEIAFGDVGPIPSIRDLALLVTMSCLLLLPESIYPSGACIAALTLFAWLALERIRSLRVVDQNRRMIIVISALGAAIGLSFAALILLAYRSPQFVEFMQERDRPPPLVLPMSFLTGAIDGSFIAYLVAQRAESRRADVSISGK